MQPLRRSGIRHDDTFRETKKLLSDWRDLSSQKLARLLGDFRIGTKTPASRPCFLVPLSMGNHPPIWSLLAAA